VSKGFSSVLKTVAMIAVPFVAAVAAPFIAPFAAAGLGAIGLGGLGSAIGLGSAAGGISALGTGLVGAATGAGLGAATGALTGRGALMGAITGGLGGGLGAAAGLGQAVGLAPAATTVSPALAAAVPGITGIGTAAGLAPAAVGGIGAAASGIAGAAAPSIAGAASPMLSNVIGNLVGKFAEGITAGGIADLAMTMYNKPEEGLTEEEKRAVYETAQLANTNKELFAQRVEQANAVWNAAQANPEKAYAEAQSGVQRGLREQQRRYGTGQYGGTGSSARQAALGRSAAIEGAKAGAAAASAETERSDREKLAAAGLLPTSAPVGPAAATLPFYGLAQKRQDEYNKELARATGGLFGGVYNKSSTPKFSLSYGQ
jgi:hypothetical protein